MKPINHIILYTLMGLFMGYLSACAPSKFQSRMDSDNATQDPRLSGGVQWTLKGQPKEKKSTYLAPIKSPKVQKAKEQVQKKWTQLDIEKNSQKLSFDIENVFVEKIKDLNFNIRIQLKNKMLKFNLLLNSSYDIISDAQELNDETYFIQKNPSKAPLCKNKNCRNTEITLVQKSNSKISALTTIMVHYNLAFLKSQRPPNSESTLKSSLLSQIHQLFIKPEGHPIRIKDVMVTHGVSIRYVNVEATSIKFHFENKDTFTQEIPLIFTQVPHISNEISGSVLSQIFIKNKLSNRILLKSNQYPEDKLHIAIQREPWKRVHPPLAPPPVNTIPDDIPAENSRQFYLTNEIETERTQRISRGLNKFKNKNKYPWVETYVQKVVKKKAKNIQNFLNKFQSVYPILKQYCEVYDLPCSLFYILLKESAMFTNPSSYIIKSKLGDSCEVGPWQFTYSTAKDSRNFFNRSNIFKITHNGNIRRTCSDIKTIGRPHTQDERQFLTLATNGAFKYLSFLMHEFSYEPLFAVQAYNKGPGFISDKLESIVNHNGLNSSNEVSYEMYFQQNYSSQYSFDFLAYYIIFSDPEKYGFRLNTQKTQPAPCEILYPPGSQRDQCLSEK